MAKGVIGMFERPTTPKMKRQDSDLKKSMKAVMKRGRSNSVKVPDRLKQSIYR